MIQSHYKVLFLTIGLLVPFGTSCKRHARIRKAERLEKRKKVVITDDQKLTAALSKQIKYMKFDDAVLSMNYYIKEQDLDVAIKCGQRAISVGGDQETMRQIRFTLAELFLEKRKLKQAVDSAEEYQKFYPGTAEAIKAQYIIIRANFLDQCQSDRDQKNTKSTIEHAEAFLTKHKQNDYTESVKEMLTESYLTLIRSEINIINTQLDNYNYTKTEAFLDAATKRIAHIREKYLPHAPVAEKKILEIETIIAKAAGKPASRPKIEKSDNVALAQSKRPRNSFVRVIKSAFVEDNNEFFA